MEAQKNQTTFGPLKQLWHSTKGNALLGVGGGGGGGAESYSRSATVLS